MSSMWLLNNISLLPFNTFRVEQKAKYFVRLTRKEDVIEILDVFNKKILNQSKIFFLGQGSNIVFTKDTNRFIIQMGMKGIEKLDEDDDFVYVKVWGGELWDDLVNYTVQKGWQGIENLSLIPGTVGAAPIQNIGAYGVELSDVFESAETVNMITQEFKTFYKQDCQFAYRDSIFKQKPKEKILILNVTLKLHKKQVFNLNYHGLQDLLDKKDIKKPTISDIRSTVISIRNTKLPNYKEVGNSGSFFKNPIIPSEHFKNLKIKYPDMPSYPQNLTSVKIPAGWLIEKANWKGYKNKNIGVSDKQSLILVNLGGGKGLEVKKLAYKIQTDIYKKFDIKLELEVNLM